MRPILCRGIACLSLLLAPALCPADEPIRLSAPQTDAPATDSSLDQFIAGAKRQAENGSTELKQLVAQLDPLRKRQQALLATRRAKEAELARLQSAGGDTTRIAALQKEIDACRKQLNVVDSQFEVLIYRIQAGPPLPGDGLITAPGQRAAATGPTPGRLTRTVPPDKIKTAADAMARNPAPSAAAARLAATQLLSASQPGYTTVEIDQLAQLIMQLAVRATEAELRAILPPTKQSNEEKLALHVKDQPGREAKPDTPVIVIADPQRIRELQARQARLERAKTDLLKPGPAVADKTPSAKK